MPRLARVAASFFILYIIYLGSLRFFLYLCNQITNIMRAIRLKFLLLSSLMTWCFLTARAQEEMIEHEGSKYIIHVEQLNPDSEMTLLDVLHICPELMSDDGKTLTANYLLSVDDIMLSADYEPLLEGIKARDLKEVIVCTYGAVNNAMDGIQGSIDLQFSCENSGKLTVRGTDESLMSSRGNSAVISNYGTLDIEGGTYKNISPIIGNQDYRRSVWTAEGTTTRISNVVCESPSQVVCTNGMMTIESGTFTCKGNSAVINNYCTKDILTINGGTYINNCTQVSGGEYRRCLWTTQNSNAFIKIGRS